MQDVRQAAQLALENLSSPPCSARTPALSRVPSMRTSQSSVVRPHGGPVRWTSEPTEHDAATDESGWRAALRATFGYPETPEDTTPDDKDE